MTFAAAKALSVIGLIIAMEGDVVRVDKGALDGLRTGDRGVVYYTLTIGSGKRNIEVARARVFKVDDTAASLEMEGQAGVRPGYAVEFKIPSDRVSAASLLMMARTRVEEGRFDDALGYLKRIEEIVPDDVFVREQIREVERQRQQREWLTDELQKVDYYRTAARDYLDRRDLKSARVYIDKILKVAPEDRVTKELLRSLEEETLRSTMIPIPGGLYEIGVDLQDALFYNQQPKIRVELRPFWIDRELVPRKAYRDFRPDASFDEAGGAPVTGVSFLDAEQFCLRLGKRLPTEFEWEVAFQQQGFAQPFPVSEWTSSLYKPYPGNSIPEEEYGEQFRVLRGPTRADRSDFRSRYFSAPHETNPDVGFRCACDPAKNRSD